eukprot:TRINITY_DN6418_c0_g1_i1.p1 TRINITY_DN6418_c0_g1~~TRINITY_DN6418_c0_g1_i1.p1  ORF type:complete len:135 (+),score=38.66 TRINITY_DN6418_c0_g1_i1:61-465(+)
MEGERPSQAAVQQFQQMRQELNALAQTIGEKEIDRSEHELVIKAIDGLDKNRRCWRLVGGVLVERTVGEVLPAVQKNRTDINKTIDLLTEQLEKKEKALTEFAIKFKLVRSVNEDKLEATQQKSNTNKTTGVLA